MKEAYVVVTLADYPEATSFVVFQQPDDWTDNDTQRITANSLLEIETLHSQIVLAMPTTIKRLKQLLENEKQSLVKKAFSRIPDKAVQVVLALSEDQQRVVTETWKEAVSRHVDFDVKSLADVSSVFLSMNSLQEGTAEIGIRASQLVASRKLFASVQAVLRDSLAAELMDVAPVDRSGPAIATIELSETWMQSKLDPWIENRNRLSAVRKFWHLGLAIHNHHSAFSELPPATVTDDEGKPLLSWRVKLLPFLGPKNLDLWRQFHMDEPWDSPHNKTLISQMPEEYQVDSTKPIGTKSTVAVPYGEAMAFHDGQSTFDQISDGMFDTIMLFEIPKDRAEIWTKPGGVAIDPDDPAAKLGRNFGPETLVGLVAGSVAWLDTAKHRDVLYALFTRSGDEKVKYPSKKEPKPTW